MYARKPVRSLAKIKWWWGQREMQDEDSKVWVKVMNFVNAVNLSRGHR